MARADLLISGRAVVTMDLSRAVIQGGAVVVTGGRIVAVGERAALAREWTADRHVGLPDGIVIPGLVNTHAHSLQTLLRGGIGAGRELYDWLTNVMYPGLAACTRRDAEVAAATFAVEAVRAGTTTVVDNGDAGLDPEIAAGTLAGLTRIGIRTVYCPLWIESVPRALQRVVAQFGAPRADALGATESSEAALERIKELRGRYDEGPEGLVQIGIGPALPQTTTETGLQLAAQVAEQEGALLTIHVAQAKVDRWVRGRSSIEYLRDIGILSPRLLAAHCVWVGKRDAELLAEHGARVAHNPTSNLFLSAGIAPIGMLRASGVVVGLGTDDANSNNAVDLFQEMKLAALLRRVRSGGSPASAEDAFAMGTIDAARAAGLGAVVGSLEPGKRADVVVIDVATAELTPMHDVYETLVFQHAAQAVDTVIVDGRVVMSGRQILDASDHAELARETQRRSDEVVRRAGLANNR